MNLVVPHYFDVFTQIEIVILLIFRSDVKKMDFSPSDATAAVN